MISPIDWGTLKIAVCMSGIARGNVSKHISLLKNAFPGADFYFSTWNEYDNEISQKYNSKTYPEPKMHYNPWTECMVDCPHLKYKAYKKAFQKGEKLSTRPKLLHATKQIIAHAYQLSDMPNYDIIVRTRWDTVVSEKVNFSKYVRQSFDERKAIGFAIRGSRWTNLHQFKDIEHIYVSDPRDQTWSRDWMYWLNDNLIIHPMDIFDCDNVHKLHQEKKLLPAEYGWYQVLSKNENHHSVYGGATIDRYA